MAYTTGGPEYMQPMPPGYGAPAEPKKGKKPLLVLGGVLGAGAVIAGAAWAATTFFMSGPQPAEALPASTVAYVSLDFDPSGSQKVEAIRMLRKFPAIQDDLKLDEDDDLVEKFFNESDVCEDIDYAKDIKPWLGSRAALAVVDVDDEPRPVGVLQVKDAGEAEKGMELLRECGGTSEDEGGYTINGDWLLIAETEKIAESIADEADKSSLADDDAYNKWTDAAGDDGIMTIYVSKEVTSYAKEALGSLPSADEAFPSDSYDDDLFSDESSDDDSSDEGYEDPYDEYPLDDEPMMDPSELTDQLDEALEDFEGAAIKVRFDDEGLEIESAVGVNEEWADVLGGGSASDLVDTLPEDTVAAFGLSFGEGYVDRVFEQVAKVSGDGTTVEELYAEAEEATGLSLPEDAETLFGEGIAVAIGPGIDPDAMANGDTDDLPFAIKIKGDTDEIEEVLDKLRVEAGDDAELLDNSQGDGVVVFGPDVSYRESVAEDGSLEDDDTYQDILGSDDALALAYVNFNADDDWLVRLVDGEEQAVENLKPLRALGFSSWVDGDVGHTLFRLTTD